MPPGHADNTPGSFPDTLARHGLELCRGEATTLQINVGLLCNQSCKHCHLEAGPGRTEVMSLETIGQLTTFAERYRFAAIDITGGAPEMNPHIHELITRLAPLTPRLMLRSNLTALESADRESLIALCRDHRVVIIASFPAVNESQADAQRGVGVFDASLRVLRSLNDLGYGKEGYGLELDLVANPPGAFLPGSQAATEKRFRDVLRGKWGIEFTHLYGFANVPLGRYRKWLELSGNLDGYLEKLRDSFNPCAVEGLMCRSLVSVDWEGYLYDCDFNLARGLPLGGERVHVSDLDGPPPPGTRIAVADHCFGCTAGAGFT